MKWLLMALVRSYRALISPLLGANKCRFTPTCSEYALVAVERYGSLKGIFLAIWRILRCHPFSKGGYDPVHYPKNHH